MTRPTTHTFCKDKKGRRCTVAIRQTTNLTDDNIPLFNIAVATTSKGDNFSRKIGKAIAYGRLDKAELRDDVNDFIDGVYYWVLRDDVIDFLTYHFDISTNRATLMIDKDLLHLPPPENITRYHIKELEATTMPAHSLPPASTTFIIEDNSQKMPF